MKTTELDRTQDVELTINPDFQAEPFTVTGSYEAVLPIVEAVQAEDARIPKNVPRKTAAAVVEAVRSPGDDILQGRRASIAAKFYALRNGRNMYALLKEKRDTDRDIAFATKLGLLSVEEIYCQKHAKVVSKLHGMVD